MITRPRLALVLAAALLGLAVSGCQAASAGDPEARPGQLVKLPDGRRLNLRCSGQGAPTVLLESGFAAPSLAWARVQPRIAATNRVCAYDRAGYGFSDEGPRPRDAAATVKDLRDALRAARITGPFVLVGHSAGGLYVRLFAARYPEDVAGMVLVDSSVEFQDLRLASAFGPGAGSLASIRARAVRCLEAAELKNLPSTAGPLAVCTPTRRDGQAAETFAARLAEATNPANWRTQISEVDALWAETSRQVAAAPGLGDTPLIVLTAGDAYAQVPEPHRARADAVWAGLHREVAARSTRGEQRVVPGSSHMMIFDKPEAIVAAVSEVITMSRAPRP